MAVLEFEPKEVFSYFEKICSMPHGSGNTEIISNYLVEFAKKQGLSYVQEPCGNVVIYKEASKGYENAPTVIIQGHMDMVCEKEPEAKIDFKKDGLKLNTQGDYIFAEHTTLGGDDGIAVAYALAVLASDTIEHPALEVVITVDEEVGMLGATALDGSLLKGKMLLNIDSEDEGILTTSCAGGVVMEVSLPFQTVPVEGVCYEILLDGLQGGHSGVEIHKERVNANIMMGRILFELSQKLGYGLETISGGLKDNAIPRAARAVIWLEEKGEAVLENTLKELQQVLRNEYHASDKELSITANKLPVSQGVMLHPGDKEKTIFLLRQLPNGVQKMSMDIPELVETSCNLGILKTTGEEVALEISVRSSVESEKWEVCDKIAYLTEFLGGNWETKGDYAGWEYNPDSKLQKIMVDVFEKMYGKTPKLEAIHAGLECGILKSKVEELECISFGPDILDIHTPKERLSISSTKRVWEYLVEVLKHIK